MLEQGVQLFITPGKVVVVVHPVAPNAKVAALTEYLGSCGTSSIQGMVTLRTLGEFDCGTWVPYTTGKKASWVRTNGMKLIYKPDG
eukprot:7421270-Heterocapsa_arctica.AAC.1